MSADEEPHGGASGIEERILKQLRAAGTATGMLSVLQQAFDSALAEDPVVVSRNERQRLLANVSAAILRDMLRDIDAA